MVLQIKVVSISKNYSYCHRRKQAIFTEGAPLSYACYGTFYKGTEGKG